LIKLKP